MHLATKKICFGDYSFDISEEVYEPAEDSFLFAENLDLNNGEQVLDMGTGSGILGVISAKKAIAVVAVDVNPYAIWCAKHNAAVNCVSEKMFFLQSDLFTSISKQTKFDVILFNAPYLPSEDSETDFWLGRAWAGGITGRQVIDRFIFQAPFYLKRTGRLLLLQSTLSDVEETKKLFLERDLALEVKAKLALPFFETLVLFEITFPL